MQIRLKFSFGELAKSFSLVLLILFKRKFVLRPFVYVVEIKSQSFMPFGIAKLQLRCGNIPFYTMFIRLGESQVF